MIVNNKSKIGKFNISNVLSKFLKIESFEISDNKRVSVMVTEFSNNKLWGELFIDDKLFAVILVNQITNVLYFNVTDKFFAKMAVDYLYNMVDNTKSFEIKLKG